MDKSLLKEFYEKHVQRWTHKAFSDLTAEQMTAVSQLPAYRTFATKRKDLIAAVKPHKTA